MGGRPAASLPQLKEQCPSPVALSIEIMIMEVRRAPCSTCLQLQSCFGGSVFLAESAHMHSEDRREHNVVYPNTGILLNSKKNCSPDIK